MDEGTKKILEIVGEMHEQFSGLQEQVLYIHGRMDTLATKNEITANSLAIQKTIETLTDELHATRKNAKEDIDSLVSDVSMLGKSHNHS